MSDEGKGRRPAVVFYSYAHKDEKLQAKLATALAGLKNEGLISEWHDRELAAGDDWRSAIDRNLDRADIILLLVSADFIASEYCWGVEVKRALERHQAAEARVIPVILRPSDWNRTPFGRLQALPKEGKPVTLWSPQDSAWLDVARGIGKAVRDLGAPRRKDAEPEAGPASAAPAAVAAPATRARVRSRKKSGRPRPHRVVRNARNQEVIPGEVVRREGDPATGDPAVDETYDALGAAHGFLWNAFGRDSIDGKGLPLEATVHYGKSFANAFWDGKRLVLGDGDGDIFNRFTSTDVVAKELMNGLVQAECGLTYWGQAGALYNTLAVVFALLVKQHALAQTAGQADWVLGTALLSPRVNGRGILSLAAPGTAYNDPRMGRDPQPDHMRDYVQTTEDNGGIHINSGIAGHAFYRLAIALGGHAWERAGRIWYDAMRDRRLKADAQFADFARLTLSHARRLFGDKSPEVEATRESWRRVGVVPRKA